MRAIKITGTALLALAGSFAAQQVGHAAPGGRLTSALHALLAPPSVATTCGGTAAARTCDLWAKDGSVALPGIANPVPVWGFTDTAPGAARLVGSTLVVNEGDVVTLTLHNTLAKPVSLELPNIDGLASDETGAAAGSTASYTFTATRPGTYLYQAGPTNGQRQQLAMGLLGALVVRSSTPNQVFDDASTAYTDESVLVLSDVDPALNNSADPSTYDMRTFKPAYRLINGKAYPDTESVAVADGGHLALRIVNAGSQDHALASYGRHQRVISDDATLLPAAQQYSVTAETVGAGQTLDTILDAPSGHPAGLQYVLADSGGELYNPQGATTGASVSFGGMLTTIAVGGTGTPATCHPAVATLGANPTALSPGGSSALSATFTACTGQSITSAEYSDGPSGPWTPMTLSGNSATATVTPSGNGKHVYFVRAADANGAGDPGTAEVYLDGVGPATGGLSVSPNPNKGSTVTVRATGDDRATGAANVVAARAVEGGASAPNPFPAGTALPLTSGGATPVAGFTGSLTVATSDGTHTVWVETQDARGNWGNPVAVTFIEDNTAPALTSGTSVAISPNPTNGAIEATPGSGAVRVSASFTDALSVITGMVGWIDTVNGNPGAVFLPKDKVWDSKTEAGYLDIPLPTIRNLSEGPHTLIVRGTDAAGSTSGNYTVTFVVDKTAPSLTAASQAASVSGRRRIQVSGTDAVGISGIEYFRGTDPGKGLGTAVAVSPAQTTLTNFAFFVTPNTTGTVYVRIRDAAGNWSAVRSVTLR